MRILLIHNQYKQHGGEDAVFSSESDLLLSNGHAVEHLLYNNTSIKTFFDKCMSGIWAIYNPESARVLKTKIRNFNPDVIHIHNFLPLVSPSVLFIAKKHNIPVVLTLHNYRLICPSAILFFKGHIYEKSIHSIFPIHAIWKGVYRNSTLQTAIVALVTATHHWLGTWKNKVDCYITLTKFACDKFNSSALTISPKKFVIKPNFVKDCGKGEFNREDFFLFIGRLTEEKGVRTLLKAAILYKFKFTIIGDGPLGKEVENFARQHPTMTYLGFQSKAVVMSYLKKCKALIFPSIWYEGFPVTILEALCTGTPVIVSNIGGMKEIIQNRVNGLHFEPGNEKDLVSKIIEIEDQDSLANSLSANGRSTYLKHYTPAKNYDQLIGVYDKVREQHELTESKLLSVMELKN